MKGGIAIGLAVLPELAELVRLHSELDAFSFLEVGLLYIK